MGAVYLAAHPRLPRRDALKVLPARHGDDPGFRARFLREAELATRLDHPNIVAVRDRGVEDGCLWITMQFVDGMDAAELLGGHPNGLPVPTALHIVAETACGLDEAHRAGLLHRDVKPGNILLEPQSAGPDRVYVTDFGIARATREDTRLTETGTVLATLAYAAPEQIAASATLDHRVDVYALGATLYELLTGRKPFPRPTAAAVMHAHLCEPAPRVTEHAPHLPSAIDEVIGRAMAKRPEDRYPTCGDLVAAVRAAMHGQVLPPLPAMRPSGRNRRAGWRIGIAGTVVAMAAGAGVVALQNYSEDETGAAQGMPNATTTPASPAPSPGGGGIGWGGYQFVVDALPSLLPATPMTSGHQGIRCIPVDADLRQIAISAATGSEVRLHCRGNKDPLDWMLLSCNANRYPRSMPQYADVTVQGDERWERSSGRGRVVWGTAPSPAGTSGVLDVLFDDPARNFCLLNVYGGTEGQILADRWWRDAPL
ncbi:serine/threonine protein kinase [Nocardia huaxiensis]|uniref:non-specific serine/threonine protein kinase n=2 Tax=Nocardia huaxiensis TaxID=2755382 RepID=A0A7D6ZMI8_9NOCA|nr:serine/threonine protein kinase [Nocardia huaxiensis]